MSKMGLAIEQFLINSWYKIALPIYDSVMVWEMPVIGRPELIKRLGIVEEERGIEVGAGTGLNLRYYPKLNEIYCVDINSKLIKKAKKKATQFGLNNLHFRLGNGRNLDFKENYFNFAILTYALSGIPNNEKVLSELERVVVPGGRIGILDYNCSFRSPIGGLTKLRLHELVQNRKNSKIKYHQELRSKGSNQSIYILNVI